MLFLALPALKPLVVGVTTTTRLCLGIARKTACFGHLAFLRDKAAIIDAQYGTKACKRTSNDILRV